MKAVIKQYTAESVIEVGKYKGKKVQWVIDNDVQYFKYHSFMLTKATKESIAHNF